MKISLIEKHLSSLEYKISIVKNLIEKYKNENIKFVSDISDNKDFSSIISLLSSQRKSPQYEKRFGKVFDLIKMKPKDCKGDFRNKDNKYIEFKCSTPSINGENIIYTLNIVQIRLKHNIDYYICMFIDDVNWKNNYIFKLTHNQMKEECDMNGANAHGTKSNESKFNDEIRITIKLDKLNKTFMRWNNKYRCKEMEKKFFYEKNI